MTVLRALFLEDSTNDADLLKRELERGGFELIYQRVQTADDMEQSLEENDWQIVFSDWSMPQFKALDALEIMKRHDLDLPFIIISGTIGEEVAVAALRSGAHDFFSKGKLVRLIPAVERELRDAAFRQERHQIQEQLLISERMASVGILAAGVGHEINNPLTSVLGNLELAQQDIRDVLRDENIKSARLDNVLNELSDAYESAQRIRNVASDLRLFSRSDSEERTAVDVCRVLESSLRMAQNEIRHRSRLTTRLSPVPAVEANESRLGQVFLNLIVNAAQSIPEGHVEENEITVETSIADDGHVTVDIGDTGGGMSADVKKRLFTPFFTTKPIGLGTGLGLSICHRIVDSYGGSITVDSELGRGSTFRVHLPATTNVGNELPAAVHLSPTHRGKILVIDDDPIVSMIAERALEVDHDVTATTNPRKALALIDAGERYDVILCDIMMPDLTGMDVYERVSQTAPEQAKVMIFMTGGAFTPRGRDFLERLENAHIEKPFGIEALQTAINERMSAAKA